MTRGGEVIVKSGSEESSDAFKSTTTSICVFSYRHCSARTTMPSPHPLVKAESIRASLAPKTHWLNPAATRSTVDMSALGGDSHALLTTSGARRLPRTLCDPPAWD